MKIGISTLVAVALFAMAGCQSVWVDPNNGTSLFYYEKDGEIVIGHPKANVLNNYRACDKKFTGDLVIPEVIDGKPVTQIGAYAFDLVRLSSVKIPDSVTWIGRSAFSGSHLKTITLPNHIEVLGDLAFSYTDIESIALPESLRSIGSYAFHNCRKLRSVIIPRGVEFIGRRAFMMDRQGFAQQGVLKYVALPGGVKHIDKEAFAESGIDTLIFPEGEKLPDNIELSCKIKLVDKYDPETIAAWIRQEEETVANQPWYREIAEEIRGKIRSGHFDEAEQLVAKHKPYQETRFELRENDGRVLKWSAIEEELHTAKCIYVEDEIFNKINAHQFEEAALLIANCRERQELILDLDKLEGKLKDAKCEYFIARIREEIDADHFDEAARLIAEHRQDGMPDMEDDLIIAKRQYEVYEANVKRAEALEAADDWEGLETLCREQLNFFGTRPKDLGYWQSLSRKIRQRQTMEETRIAAEKARIKAERERKEEIARLKDELEKLTKEQEQYRELPDDFKLGEELVEWIKNRSRMTSLQKSDSFRRRFKDRYVAISGKINDVGEPVERLWRDDTLYVTMNVDGSLLVDVKFMISEEMHDVAVSWNKNDQVTLRGRVDSRGDLVNEATIREATSIPNDLKGCLARNSKRIKAIKQRLEKDLKEYERNGGVEAAE